MKRRTLILPVVLILLFHVPVESQAQNAQPYSGWHAYGGNGGGTRFAPLDQITGRNVDRLELAWSYRSGELGQGSPVSDKLTFEATPIYFENTLYF
ncbi:MAG: membrane-bound PQQ-dependent dehydrogenase, glucose/quinate/shikimate family, partial [Bacteroidetes bacterium]|nr:membrane-bound PQQ-dependent dehydrogenase, glucose/quinate/shikimate family [Bacteroidota bacterium]